MRRFERRRAERLRYFALVAGLSFALGALASLGLSWRLADQVSHTDVRPALEGGGTPASPMPPHDPSGPAPFGAQLRQSDAPRPKATTGTSPGHTSAVDELRDRDLIIPVEGVDDDDLRDSYFDSRGGRLHEALDIMAPRHRPVRAVEDGRVAKLFTSKAGGITVYMFDPSERFCYYYAHLDRYASGLREGQELRQGDVIGYVGSTGNASATAPHLHFAIFRLTSEKQWWKGEPLNPYLILR
jgi:murein DD-endopeptidase MepM/ murein hydrolase activator NlpD